MADHEHDHDVDAAVQRREALTERFRTYTEAEIREQRQEIHAVQTRMLREAEGGVLSTEQDKRFDELTDQYEDMGAILQSRADERDAKAKAQERAKELEEREKSLGKSTGRKTTPDGEQRGNGKPETADAIYDTAFRKWSLQGWKGLNEPEVRALQADQDDIGGSLVMKEAFVNQLIKFVDDRVHMLQLATTFNVPDADSGFFPSWDTDPADADWTSELNTGSEDSSARTGGRKLEPRPLAKRIKISRTLLRKAMQPAESLVRDRLGYKFQVTLEKALLTGTGANQPLGIFTASANGISTSRDVSTGNTTTAIKADGLIEALYSLKEQYINSPNTRWIFHRDAIKNIRKLKDGEGNYLWVRGLAGAMDTILEKPYLMSEFAPSTFTSGLYVGCVGDFSWMYVMFAMQMELQRLDELYAETNQIGIIGRLEADAMPVLEEAFARVTLAT